MKFKEYNQKQGIFKVIVPDELLDSNDPARIIDKVFKKLDLSKIYEKYQEVGNTAYHPEMMLKVLFYSYYLGIHSCRKMWDALKKRADFIFLSGDQLPDFRTLNDFRLRHIDEIPDIFSQVVMLCESLGMIGFENLAIDGQKIQANANFSKTYNKERFENRYNIVKEGIKKLLVEEIEDKGKEDQKQVKRKLRKLQLEEKKLNKLSGIFKELKSNESLNTTDIDSKSMQHKDNTSKPSYNHQSAVDGKYGVTVSVQTISAPDHADHVLPLVDKAVSATGKTFQNIMADSAFSKYDLLKKVELERDENFFIHDKKEGNFKSGIFRGKFDISRFELKNEELLCPAGKKMHLASENEEKRVFWGIGCDKCKLKNECTDGIKRTVTIVHDMKYRNIMREKLSSEEGKIIYQKRQGIVEPTHGDDQKNKSWRQHHLRGLKKAKLEFQLMRIVSNIAKMIRYRTPEILAWN